MKKVKMTIEERKKRIIARGEHSNHSHIITGDVDVIEENGKIKIIVGEDSNAAIKHLLEKEWIEGKEVWTKEHTDIPLEKGEYYFVQQIEYNPLNELISAVRD